MNTDDPLGGLMTELAARADTHQVADRLDRVHARARRATRVRVLGASLVALLLVAGVAALSVRGTDLGGAQTPAGPGTSAPAILPTTAGPAPSATMPSASTPSATAPSATGPSAVQSPTSSRQTSTLVPADSVYPAFASCSTSPGAVVTIDANPDVPSPRCVSVGADQRLQVVNRTTLAGSPPKTITVTFADFAPRVLAPGQTTTFDRPFGDYLATGIHVVRMAPLYAAGGADVWLRN